MKVYNCLDTPIEINGLLGSCGKGAFHKLPDSMFGVVSKEVTEYGHRANGGRIRFRTNTKNLKVCVRLLTLTPARYFSIVGSAGCSVIAGLSDDCRYLGSVAPLDYDTKYSEETYLLNGGLVDITIYFPRNEWVEDVTIEVDDEAVMEAPTSFAYPLPIVFYGSSITEGCTTVHPANSYVALTCRWLNADYINLGFSGAARGETAMAEFIKTIPMQAFVLDYDHNAPSAEELRRTHEPFFRIVREANQDLPILMMTRPDTDRDKEDSKRRRDVVLDTYRHAQENGDHHVYFIDGNTFFGHHGRFACTIDTLHPNDTGMMRMAEIVTPKLKEIL